MSKEQFLALPASITVRELRYGIHEKGFRPNKSTLVTTLFDSERYTLSDLADQFLQRWAKSLEIWRNQFRTPENHDEDGRAEMQASFFSGGDPSRVARAQVLGSATTENGLDRRRSKVRRPSKGDYRLQPNSPVFKLGFQAIDLSKVGIRTAKTRE